LDSQAAHRGRCVVHIQRGAPSGLLSEAGYAPLPLFIATHIVAANEAREFGKYEL